MVRCHIVTHITLTLTLPYLTMNYMPFNSSCFIVHCRFFTQVKNGRKKWMQSCRDDAMMRTLAYHQCGPGSIPGLGVICGLSLLLVLVLVLRGFSPGTLFFLFLKNQDFQIPINQIPKSEGHRFVSRGRLLSVGHTLIKQSQFVYLFIFFILLGLDLRWTSISSRHARRE